MRVIREANSTDWGFIVIGWERSFRTSFSAGLINMDDWQAVMEPQIHKVLNRPDAKTLVVCSDRDPTYLYGFMTADLSEPQPYVFYVYVKQLYRLTGVARMLFDAFGIDPQMPFQYACSTPSSYDVNVAGKIPRARHRPMYARHTSKLSLKDVA